MFRSRYFYRASIVFAILASSTMLSCSEQGQEEDSESPHQTTTPEKPQAPIAGIAIEDLPLAIGALSNTDSITENLGLKNLQASHKWGSGIKIAVLDNGFSGVNHAIGKTLPPDTELVKADGKNMQDTSHGTKMAEIAYAVATGSPYYRVDRPGPKMVLLNTNGFTNFKWAVDQAIARDVDIILYAQVWEYGGNLDGKGFINQEVTRAVQAGILWVNAAGNLHESTWRSGINRNAYNQVALPHQNQYVRLAVDHDNTPVKLVLAWNDFAESADYHTPQDLDLYVETVNGEPVAQSTLIQDGTKTQYTDDSGNTVRDIRYSAHAREIVRTTLDAGIHHLRVMAKSRNFDASSQLRITADGFGTRLIDQTQEESILIPADHKQVIAVGASDVGYSARSLTLDKPDVLVESTVRFSGGFAFDGTSAATAIFSGATATYLSWHKEKFGHKPAPAAYLQRYRDGSLTDSSGSRQAWFGGIGQ